MIASEAFRQYLGTLEYNERGIIALDDMTHHESAVLLTELKGYFGIAKENANAQSGGWLDAVVRNERLGFELMADAKYHDTLRTMKAHVKSTTLDGARLITVHTSADVPALKAAVEGRDEARMLTAKDQSEHIGSLLGITVLTSITDARCEVIYGMSRKEKVLQLAGFAFAANLEGVVCAGTDLPFLHADPDLAKLIKVVPGIVLPGEEKPSGQEETVTPEEAMGEGADFIVLGSAVTKAKSRIAAAELVLQGIAKGLAA